MIEYQSYLCIIVFTRLAYLRQDGPTSWFFSTGLGLIQALFVLLIFGLGAPSGIAALTAFVLTALCAGLEKQWSVYWARLTVLAGLAVVPAAMYPLLGAFSLSPVASACLGYFHHVAVLIGSAEIDAERLLSVLLGLLLLANEVNIAMRGIFQSLDLVPRLEKAGGRGAQAETDEREYNAGRVIGILERWLMFSVVLFSSDWSALGFIIAAKGLVRFDWLKNQTFAEYLLVGTLLSALFAVVVARLAG